MRRGRYLLLSGVVTAIFDGLFATAQAEFFYDSSFKRLWQGVASVPLGREAFEGGTRTVLIGLGLHVLVAFTWSAVFIFLVLRSESMRRVLDTPGGALRVAAVYGPCIWMVMSLVVIPVLARRPPNITTRWWIQLAGHIFFVGLPIVLCSRGAARRQIA